MNYGDSSVTVEGCAIRQGLIQYSSVVTPTGGAEVIGELVGDDQELTPEDRNFLDFIGVGQALAEASNVPQDPSIKTASIMGGGRTGS